MDIYVQEPQIPDPDENAHSSVLSAATRSLPGYGGDLIPRRALEVGEFASILPAAFQQPSTWLSSRTGATASNFPTHFSWTPAKIGERPYKYVKQEVRITQGCKFPVIDAL